MKLTKNFEKEELVNKIEDNRELMLPLGVLVVGIILIIFIIVPQMISFPSKLSERNTEIARLNDIKNAKEILENTFDEELDNRVEVVSFALPITRDFEGILNAIATAANLSSSQVTGYTFKDASQLANPEGEATSRAIKFDIGILGTPDQAALFLEELYKTGPIAAVKGIEYSDGESIVEVEFYYKPFTSLEKDAFLPKELTAEQQKILSEITSFNKPVSEPVVDIPPTSTSSSLLDSVGEN